MRPGEHLAARLAFPARLHQPRVVSGAEERHGEAFCEHTLPDPGGPEEEKRGRDPPLTDGPLEA